MFIMVHDLELSVGGQVCLGETWALITVLACSGAVRIDLIKLYKIVTRYLVDRHCVPTPMVPLETMGNTVHMNVHANAYISVLNHHECGHGPRGLRI